MEFPRHEAEDEAAVQEMLRHFFADTGRENGVGGDDSRETTEGTEEVSDTATREESQGSSPVIAVESQSPTVSRGTPTVDTSRISSDEHPTPLPVTPQRRNETQAPTKSLATRKAEEDDSMASWYAHRRHTMVITYSGKPVFSRYGAEHNLGVTAGTLAAIIAKCASLFGYVKDSDALRYLSTSTHTFAFLERGPLWLVCISSARDSFAVLVDVLTRMHLQIITILSGSVERTLTLRPNSDVRSLLGGMDSVLGSLAGVSFESPASMLGGIESLPLSPNMRYVATKSLRAVATPKPLLAGVLLAGRRLVAMSVSPHLRSSFESCDLAAVVNLVISSASLKHNETWTPVCLPHFNARAMLHMYVKFLHPPSDFAVLFISPTSDADQFHALSTHCEKRCLPLLHNSGCFSAVVSAVECSPFLIPPSVSTPLGLIHALYGVFLTDGTATGMGGEKSPSTSRKGGSTSGSFAFALTSGSYASPLSVFPRSARQPHPSTSSSSYSGASSDGVLRFPQFFSSAMMGIDCRRLDDDSTQSKRLMAAYREVHGLLGMADNPAHVYLEAKHLRVYGMRGVDGRLMVVAVPQWKDITTEAVQQLAKWLRQQEDFLFLSVAPLLPPSKDDIGRLTIS